MQKELIAKIENHNRKIIEAFNPENNSTTKTENEIEITSHSFYITHHDEWNLNTKELDKFLDEMVEKSIGDMEVDVVHHFRNKNVKVYSYVFTFNEDNKITKYCYYHAARISPKKKAD